MQVVNINLILQWLY